MQSERLDRRQLLRAAGVAAAATAGCTGVLDDDGRSDEPSVDDRSAYTHWWPVPRAFGGSHDFPLQHALPSAAGVVSLVGPRSGLINPRTVVAFRPAAVSDAVEDFARTDFYVAGGWMRRFGAPVDAVDRFVSFDGGMTFAGSFGEDDVATRLDEMGYERRDDHRGYAVYASSGDGYGVGVTESEGRTRVVAGSRTIAAYVDPGENEVGKTGPEVVETIVDAAAGETDRFADADPSFDAVSDAVGAGSVTAVATHDATSGSEPADWEFPGLVAEGATVVPGDPGRLLVAARFESSGDAEDASIRDALSADAALDGVEAESVSRDGRLVQVEGEVPAAATPGLYGVTEDD